MKSLKYIVLAGLLFAGVVSAQTTNPISPWVFGTPSPLIRPTVSSSSVQIPSLAGASCIGATASGTLQAVTCGTGGSGATTTINGVEGPDFFLANSADIILDPGILPPTFQFLFASHDISQFTNNSGYLTAASGSLLYYPLSSNPAGYVTSSALLPYALNSNVVNSFNGATGTVTFAESDPKWTASSSNYFTKGEASSTFYPLNSNPTGYVTSSIVNGYQLSLNGNYVSSVQGATGTIVFTTSTNGSSWQITGNNFNFPNKIYSLNSAPSVTGTLPVMSNDGTFHFMAPGSNGYILFTSSTAPNGLQWRLLDTSVVPENGNLYYTDARARAALSSSATGLSYNNGTGVFTLTSGYEIPTTASTSDWNSRLKLTSLSATNPITYNNLTGAIGWTNSNGYITTSSLSNTATGLTYNNVTGITSLTAGYEIPLTASTSNWQSFYLTPSSRITAGASLAWTGNTLAFTTTTDTKVFLPRAGNTTQSTLNDFFNMYSSGRFSGGVISASGTVAANVTAGYGTIATSTDSTSSLVFANWSALNNISIPASSTIFIGVSYNNGNPIIATSTTDSWSYRDSFPLGNVTRDGEGIHVTNNPRVSADVPGTLIRRFHQTLPWVRDELVGGLMLGEKGTRNVTVSTGYLWDRNNRFFIPALDTSVTSTFDAYYRDASTGFIASTTRTQWDNLHYDDGSGTLANLASNRYANQFWYLEPDGDLVMIYGRFSYTSAAAASAGPVPATLPERLTVNSKLIARATFKQGDPTYTAIDSAFTNTFTPSAVTNHANLSNLDYNSSGHTGFQASLTAGTNIVLSGTTLSVTTTPSFTSVTIPSITNTLLATDANGKLIATSTNPSGIQSLNGSTSSTQTFATGTDTNVQLTIGTLNGVHTFTPVWAGTLADSRITSAATWNAKITTSSLSVAYGPLAYNNVTGVFSLPTSTNSQSGFLSSADWTTFNGKQNAISFPIPVASTSLAVVGPLALNTNTLSMPTSTATQDGFLKGADFATFAAKITTSSLSSSATGLSYNGTTGVFTWTAGYEGLQTSSSTAWNTAYSERRQWDGGSTNLVAATGRTSLGLTDTATLASTTWVLPTRAINSGTGLTGGGDLSADRTLALTGHALILHNLASTTGGIIVGSSTAGWVNLGVGTDGKVLMSSSTAQNGVSWETVTSGGTPGGATTQLQYNNGGVFAGDSTFTFTSSSKLVAIASSTISGRLVIPNATASVLSTTGAIGVNTTAGTFSFHDGNAQQYLSPLLSFDWSIENPTSTEDDVVHTFNATSTIVSVYVVNKTTGDTVSFNLLHDASRTKSTSSAWHVFSSDQTVTTITTPSILTTFASSTVNKDSVMRFYTSAASSTQVGITVYYKLNQ